MKIKTSFSNLAVSCLALVMAPLAFSQGSVVSLAEAAHYTVLSTSQNEEPCMEAAATLSGSGLITGVVTQQFDVDAAFVDSIGNAQQAAGLAPDHVVSSFSGPLMVASPNLQRLLDAAGNPVISGKDFPDIRVKGEADEKLVLYVFGRSDIESGGMVDESFAITLMGDAKSFNQLLVEGPEPSSASLMGLVGFLILSVRRCGGWLKEKASPVLVDSSLDGW